LYEGGGGGGGGGSGVVVAAAFHFEAPLLPSLLTAIAVVSESEEPVEDEEAKGGRVTRQKHTPSVRGGGARRGPQKKKNK